MDKKEILERHKFSNPSDEGQEYIENKGNRYSIIAMSVFSIFILMYNSCKGINNDGYWALMELGWMSDNYARYKYTKEKIYIFLIAFWAIMFLLSVYSYIKNTI